MKTIQMTMMSLCWKKWIKCLGISRPAAQHSSAQLCSLHFADMLSRDWSNSTLRAMHNIPCSLVSSM